MVKKPQKPGPASPGHPIAVVAQRTGLSRDILRAWERRYAAVEPGRTSGGQRLYSDAQVDRFRLLAAATKHGRSIKTVASLPTTELERLVAADEAHRPAPPAHADGALHADLAEALLVHAVALDGASLDRQLRRTIARCGIPAFLQEIVPTLMRRIGDEWQAGRLTIAHEHFASAAVLTIILEAMRSVPEAPAAPRLLVATPAGERHTLGAALAAAVAALDGWTIIYLGVDVPAAEIVAAALTSRADAVALSIVHTENPAAIIREVHAVRASLPDTISIITGGEAAVRMTKSLKLTGIVVCDSVAGMRRVLARAAQVS